jgi:hypothetical protein
MLERDPELVKAMRLDGEVAEKPHEPPAPDPAYRPYPARGPTRPTGRSERELGW